MNALQRYFRERESLIFMYGQGDMTKSEYLEENLKAVLSLNIDAFENVDSLEKALFNYQYYNALAKESGMYKHRSRCPKEKHRHTRDQNFFYNKKDDATLDALHILEFFEVESYFIPVRSKELRGKLFEILLGDEEMILHSANPYILKRLREERVFSETSRRSVIDSYVNQRY